MLSSSSQKKSVSAEIERGPTALVPAAVAVVAVAVAVVVVVVVAVAVAVAVVISQIPPSVLLRARKSS